jgi:hypothetical protein
MKIRAETWKEKCEAVSVLNGLAMFAVVGGLVLIGISFSGHPGGHDLTGFRLVGLPPSIIGGAALLGRKSTAVLFCLMCVSVPLFVIISCFMTPSHPAMVVSVLVSLFLCLPMWFTVRGWDALK